MGILLMFLQPCFYCNVNDAWTFESRAAKIWVTAAGGFIESVLGSACVLVWAATEPGSSLHGVAEVVFMISLSSTILFNLNPLIKLDGYYILADLLRIENLKERSTAQVASVARRIIRLPAARVTRDRREAWILGIYGVLSMAYMAGLILMILTVLGSVVFQGESPGILTVGFLAMIAWLLLKRPVLVLFRGVKEMIMSNRETLRSPRFRLALAGGAAVAVLVSLVLPWTESSAGVGVVEAGRLARVTAPLQGRVAEVLVSEGEEVKEGQVLIRLSVPEERAGARQARAAAAAVRRDALRARANGDAAGAAARERQADSLDVQAADLERRLEGAVVRSPIAGVVAERRPQDLVGAVVQREQTLLAVADCSFARVEIGMDGRQVAPVRTGMDAVVRLHARPGESLRGKVVSVSQQPLAAPEEGAPRHWVVVVEAPDPGRISRPGMSAVAEVAVARTTLAASVMRSVRGTFRPDLLR